MQKVIIKNPVVIDIEDLNVMLAYMDRTTDGQRLSKTIVPKYLTQEETQVMSKALEELHNPPEKEEPQKKTPKKK